jgi:hypothetical protein
MYVRFEKYTLQSPHKEVEMKTSVSLLTLAILFSTLLSPSHAYVRFCDKQQATGPVLMEPVNEAHDVSDVYMEVSNIGVTATNLTTGNNYNYFPASSRNRYVFGTGLWFGAKFDYDEDGTLDKLFSQAYNPMGADSEFREGRGDQDPDDPLTRVFDSTEPEDLAEWPPQFSDPGTGEPIVYSDQDLVATYTTKDSPPLIGEYQIPLEVNQRSMVMISPDSIDQVIFFIFEVTNTSDEVMEEAWVGYLSDMDIDWAFSDDLTSIINDRITPAGDTIKLDVGYAWDSDFDEIGFEGVPGFVGVSFILNPGNPADGIDNDGDGLTDESPFNGIDDDLDGLTDEWDEVDDLGLVNFSKICNWGAEPCELNDPQSDSTGYDILSCNTPGSPITCLESTTPADVRFMLSSGSFDWLPGQTQTIAYAFVFANSVGSPESLAFVGDPPRPDPNDPALSEFVRITEMAHGFFPTVFLQSGIGGGPPGGIELPRAFALFQNFPNPFNPMTTISYEIKEESVIQEIVELSVFDVRGRRVRTLVDGPKPPGEYDVNWDGKDQSNRLLPTGTYLYSLKVGDFVSTRKMNLVK